jgi:ketosteroid isomerase-like protein
MRRRLSTVVVLLVLSGVAGLSSRAVEQAAPQPAPDAEGATVAAWLKGYDAAFNAKDLEKLATFYHPDVTIYEGGGINDGWADYRDRHLGPELKEFQNLQFAHSNTKVTVHAGGQSAYATSEYTLKAKMGEREVNSGGLETLVLIKGADGAWKIRHSHTSSRPRRPPQ